MDREAFDRKYTARLNLQQSEAVHAVDGAALRRATGLLPQLIGLKILKYTKYSCDFQTSIWNKSLVARSCD